MRTLEEREIPFWNNTSIFILLKSGFIFELNNGLITGVELEGENKNGNKNEG